MLRRLVRSYFKLRYLPRLIIEMLTNVVSLQKEIASLQTGMAGVLTGLGEDVAEISSFCDDATKAMMASKTRQLDTRAEVERIRLGLQQLENKVTAALAGVDNTQTVLAEVVQRQAVLAEAVERQAGLVEAVQRQAGELARIDRITTQQVRLLPSMLWAPETASQIRSILALLEPKAVQGVGKIRVGRDHDGGYVMLDDFAGIATALSLGIADDVSWDEDIAAHGIEVLQFDPSIAAPPVTNERFHFEPLRIDPYDHPNAISIDTVVSSRIGDPTAPLLLKIDIEGGEWDVFQAMSEPVLRRFRQIVCEFHDLDRLNEVEFGARARAVFTKLSITHAVIHVHGNNCGNFTNVANVVVPQVLEVSFALREAYILTDAVMSFPTPLDRPNEPGRADLYLGPFLFGEQHPGDQSIGQDTVLQHV